MNTTSQKSRPPSPPRPYYKDMKLFLDLIRRVNLQKVDAKTLKANSIAPSSERYVVAALRQMGLIDEGGTPTEDMRVLQTRGQEAEGVLKAVFERTYAALLEAVRLDSATYQDVYNFFILQAGLAPSTAGKCAKFFLEMAQDVGVELSEDLSRAAGTPSSQKFGKAHLRGSSSLSARAVVTRRSPETAGPRAEFAQREMGPKEYLLRRLIDTMTVVPGGPDAQKETVEVAAAARQEDIKTIRELISEMGLEKGREEEKESPELGTVED